MGRVRRNLSLVARQIDYFKDGRAPTIMAMARIYELASEMKHALLRCKLDEFGRLAHESYLNKEDMNPQMTDWTITDQLYEVALDKGAVGGMKWCSTRAPWAES